MFVRALVPPGLQNNFVFCSSFFCSFVLPLLLLFVCCFFGLHWYLQEGEAARPPVFWESCTSGGKKLPPFFLFVFIFIFIFNFIFISFSCSCHLCVSVCVCVWLCGCVGGVDNEIKSSLWHHGDDQSFSAPRRLSTQGSSQGLVLLPLYITCIEFRTHVL